MFPDRSLEAKVAVITGGANGIGYAIAERLAIAGSHVYLVDIDKSRLVDATESITRAGGASVLGHIQSDLRSVAGVVGAFKQVAELTSTLDILVNNAGGSQGTPIRLEDVSEDDYESVLNLNLRATFFAAQAVVPLMRRAGGGSIVNIASISGRAGIDTISPQYSAAKGGVLALTRSLAKHLGPDNIRVNAVAPGYIRSGPRVEAIWNSRDQSPILGSIALGRRGEPLEVAEAVQFLASDAAAYISGATIDVNGAFLAV